MEFPVVIHKVPDSDFGVTMPDLPGCFSGGTTMYEALVMAREAIEVHLDGLLADGLPIPRPTRIADHQGRPEYKDGVWALVNAEPPSRRIA